MASSNFVLRALRILGLEEMLKLSEVLRVKQVPLKKAAGEELIAWDEAPAAQVRPNSLPEGEAKILPFPQKTPEPEVGPVVEEEEDMLLWQREMARQSEETLLKLDAFKGYKKATEMYVVKTPTLEGKDKIRFAATEGVLINKKQA